LIDNLLNLTGAALAPFNSVFDTARATVRDLVCEGDQLAEIGVSGLTIPEEYGGLDLSKASMVVVSEELSRGLSMLLAEKQPASKPPPAPLALRKTRCILHAIYRGAQT